MEELLKWPLMFLFLGFLLWNTVSLTGMFWGPADIVMWQFSKFKKRKIQYGSDEYVLYYRLVENVSMGFGGVKSISRKYELKDKTMRYHFKYVSVDVDDDGRVTFVHHWGLFDENGKANPESWLAKVICEVPLPPSEEELKKERERIMEDRDLKFGEKLKVCAEVGKEVMHPERRVFQEIMDQVYGWDYKAMVSDEQRAEEVPWRETAE